MRYIRFTPEDGHKDEEVSEKKALEMVTRAINEGRLVVITTKDGTVITSADAVHAKGEAGEGLVKQLKLRVRKLFKDDEKAAPEDKKVERVAEIQPVSGG